MRPDPTFGTLLFAFVAILIFLIVMSGMPEIELWADSFHEGTWVAQGIVSEMDSPSCARENELGFIPRYKINGKGWKLDLVVFGGYGNWPHIPDKIAELIQWGKPDIIAYDRKTDTVLFAVEETAAVPTGNQALQRCERMHGAGMMKVPFWYLLSQYGTHVDEGIRQASPWPALMSMGITKSQHAPNLVLLYSSVEEPEDYSKGAGKQQLFAILAAIMVNFAKGRPTLSGTEKLLETQYRAMLKFIDDTIENVSDYFPGKDELTAKETPLRLAKIAAGNSSEDIPLLDWPKFARLPIYFKERQKRAKLIKHDAFLSKLEEMKDNHSVYTLSTNAGSRPQPVSDLSDWIASQINTEERAPAIRPPVGFRLKIADFPESKAGLRHVTTATNILYLCDSAKDIARLLGLVFPRLKKRLTMDSLPAIVYVSNSVKPGRIFGDPYTGQFSAFSWIFGGTSNARRIKIAYFPHQSRGLLKPEIAGKNKGQTVFISLADYIIFGGGAVYDTKSKIWI